VRARLRRLWLGLATVSGLARRGWFIPGRHAGPARRLPYRSLEPLFEAAAPRFRVILDDVQRYAADLDAIPADDLGLRWRQTWFPRLDAAAAYVVVRATRPRRIVEIGSGHSTRFLVRAVADSRLATAIVCIDPAPRAAIGSLPVAHAAATLEATDPGLTGALAAGDILFIDSSHVAMPGSDVDILFLDVLPGLPAGVLVHVHDIFLPDAYPAGWEWRGYNEQLLVGALLQGGGFDLVWSSRYVATRMADAVARSPLARLPLADDAFETSLWLRKR